jgi:hypothetical protein
VIYEEFDKNGIPDKKTEVEDGKKTEFERSSIFPGE